MPCTLLLLQFIRPPGVLLSVVRVAVTLAVTIVLCMPRTLCHFQFLLCIVVLWHVPNTVALKVSFVAESAAFVHTAKKLCLG